MRKGLCRETQACMYYIWSMFLAFARANTFGHDGVSGTAVMKSQDKKSRIPTEIPYNFKGEDLYLLLGLECVYHQRSQRTDLMMSW